MTANAKEMTITRIFDVPFAAVWKAWSDGEQVMRWWGPLGFTAPVARMDFRVGGTSLVCMRAPAEYGGMDMYNTWTYTRIVPMERVEFIQHFAGKDGSKIEPSSLGLPPDIPFEVPHVLTFRALGDHQTEFTVTEYGYTSDQTVEMSRGGMAQCLDKLAQSLK